MKYADFTGIPDITGKVIFVTGGVTGLGRSVVTVLAKQKPAHIYVGGRNQARADAFIAELHGQDPDVEITFLKTDLSVMSTVDEAARSFIGSSDRLDILLCNGGIMSVPAAVSKDGYEVQFATNHLGHALLMKHLLPTLLRTAEKYGDARVVSLSSTAINLAFKDEGIIFRGLNTPQDYGFGSNWRRYGQSKLANLLYAAELARRYPTLSVASVHPGVIFTDLVTSMGFFDRSIVYLTTLGKTSIPEEGALNPIWACTASRESIESGAYYEPLGEPGKHATWSQDKDLAAKLWDWTQEALKEHNI